MNLEHLMHLLKEHHLEEHTGEILSAVRSCIRIYLDEPGFGAVGKSRIGGSPDLPSSLVWPRDPKSDKALSFILQIALTELPQSLENPLPTHGMLYCFVGENQDYSNQIQIYLGDEVLAPTNPPKELLTDWFDELKAHTLRFEWGPDIPDWTSNAQDELIERLQIEDQHALSNIASALRTNSIAKLLGWARGIGHDLTEDAYVVREINPDWMFDYKRRQQIDMSPAKSWVGLMEVDSIDEVNLMFGDCGWLSAVIHENDLKNLDFTRVYVSSESS